MACPSFRLLLLLILFFHGDGVFAADSTNNPADQLVALVNSNRTAHKSPALFDNQGLGCIALEYIKAYNGECKQVGERKVPVESSFADTFAPNCGVDASSLTPITGRLLGCQSDYVSPDQAFDMLIKNSRSLQILYDKAHTEVGAAVSSSSGSSPYFWCVLFSNGTSNSSFAVNGEPKLVRPGCYSGNSADCSSAAATASGAITTTGTGLLSVFAGLILASAASAFAL